jgi:hypothetical protein
MVKSKPEIIEKLTAITGHVNEDWKNWPVHRLLVEIDKHKAADEEALIPEKSFRSHLYGTFRAE